MRPGGARNLFLQSMLDKLCKVCYAKTAKQALHMPGRAKGCDLLLKTSIPALRKARKLSQQELAYKIAHYFGLTIEEVFDFSQVEV